MAQMKEQSKTLEKELSDKNIDNLSDAGFKTLVIRMLTELVEFGHKLDEKMKATLSEVKDMYKEPTVTGRKPGFKSTMWTRRKKETFNHNKMKKKEF